MIRSHFSSVMSRNALKPGIPALLTRTSGGPTSVRTRCDGRVDLGPVGHVHAAVGRPLAARGRRARRPPSGPRSASRSSTTTANPSWPRRMAMARPIPEPAPVTMATRPVLTRRPPADRGPRCAWSVLGMHPPFDQVLGPAPRGRRPVSWPAPRILRRPSSPVKRTWLSPARERAERVTAARTPRSSDGLVGSDWQVRTHPSSTSSGVRASLTRMVTAPCWTKAMQVAQLPASQEEGVATLARRAVSSTVSPAW